MPLVRLIAEYILISILIAPFSLRYARMDGKGSMAAFFVGLVVYLSLGFRGFLILLAFHVLGAAATRIGYDRKTELGVAQRKRSFDNVLANGFFPAVAAALAGLLPQHSSMLFVGYVSAVAAAAADTVSSEIGELSASRPRLITTFEEVEAGTDGAISILGTFSGLLAALCIPLFALLVDVRPLSFSALFIPAAVAGFAGTLIDSLLGATAEQRGLIGNNTVNALSTGAGLLLSIALYSAVA
ncbi:MAG: DUF92 domain-containing protein [Methanobacteriota archaeon]|nr:MAG: DUF92 domain-containing protein [Euryarchaeota archaeon]